MFLPLSKGFQTEIDDADGPLATRWKWHVQVKPYGAYARRGVKVEGRCLTVYLHRVLMDAPPDAEVDHIDRNGLNNRRSNLRLVTHSQNMWNRDPDAGVTRRRGRWRATITHTGKKIDIGLYECREDAVLARSFVAGQLRGEFHSGSVPERFRLISIMPAARRLILDSVRDSLPIPLP